MKSKKTYRYTKKETENPLFIERIAILRGYLRRNNLTQSDLADMLAIEPTAVGHTLNHRVSIARDIFTAIPEKLGFKNWDDLAGSIIAIPICADNELRMHVLSVRMALADISKSELADKAHVDRESIISIMQKRPVRPKTLEKIATVLGFISWERMVDTTLKEAERSSPSDKNRSR